MKIHVTRDSVAAGDDCDAPHHREFSFPDTTTIEDAINQINKSGYLASIMGGCATWSAASGFPIAVMAQQWHEIRPVSWQVVNMSKLQTNAKRSTLLRGLRPSPDTQFRHLPIYLLSL